MKRLKIAAIFCSVIFGVGCSSTEHIEREPLVEKALKVLENHDELSADINSIRVDGIPLVIALSFDGINRNYIRWYEGKGGEYNFPSHLLNPLCDRNRFDEAIYFIRIKKVKISSDISNDTRANCIVTAIDKLNERAVKDFITVIVSNDKSQSTANETLRMIDERIKILQGFNYD